MKKITVLLVFSIAAGSVAGQKISERIAHNFNKLKWLENTWVRTNNKPGQSGQERWQKSAAYELHGFCVTMKGNDTVFVEKLVILVKEDTIYYVAGVPENKKLVYFKLSEITDKSFVCENPDHDFPKKIAYYFDGTKLKATVSGNGKAIDYLFVRK